MPAWALEKAEPKNATQCRRLLEVWEASVRATHTFLSEEDIQSLKPQVAVAFLQVTHLFCLRDARRRVQAFLGVEGDKIEMLFVHPAMRGRGLGRLLVRHARENLAVRRVDVNEQNPQALGFYLRLGFMVSGRSALDDQGRPFPLLHLEVTLPEKKA